MARGDHIKVSRLHGLYTHHGIDVGDGTVVHFSGEPIRMRDAVVCQVPLDEFLQGGEARVVAYAPELRTPDTVVAEALKHTGETRYDLWRNNCEHFAVYCKTGAHKSGQVRRVAKVAAGAALFGGAAVVAVAQRQWQKRREARSKRA